MHYDVKNSGAQDLNPRPVNPKARGLPATSQRPLKGGLISGAT